MKALDSSINAFAVVAITIREDDQDGRLLETMSDTCCFADLLAEKLSKVHRKMIRF